jgi:hypothetical protein
MFETEVLNPPGYEVFTVFIVVGFLIVSVVISYVIKRIFFKGVKR